MLAVVIIFAFFFMYFDDFSKKVRLKSPIAQYWIQDFSNNQRNFPLLLPAP